MPAAIAGDQPPPLLLSTFTGMTVAFGATPFTGTMPPGILYPYPRIVLVTWVPCESVSRSHLPGTSTTALFSLAPLRKALAYCTAIRPSGR